MAEAYSVMFKNQKNYKLVKQDEMNIRKLKMLSYIEFNL